MKRLLRNPWTYRIAYIAGTAILLVTEFGAIFNSISGDTITEGFRSVIFTAPILWYTMLGLWIGFGVWFFRHMFWRKK